nr:tyrosine-type recombinase/integrase [Henriciella sp.]
MNPEDLPPYVKTKTLSGGRVGYYWAPRTADIRGGFTPASVPLGQDYGRAVERAKALNADLYNWRAGVVRERGDTGTVGWMMDVYRKTDRFNDNRKETQRDYDRVLKKIAAMSITTNGKPIKDMPCEKVRPRHADKLYREMMKSGSRQAQKAMTIMKTCWAAAYRQHDDIIPLENPFADMKLSHTAQETKHATYGQLTSFTSKAIAMGEPAVAAAAQLVWDLHVRPTEAFRDFRWKDWRPDDHPHHCFVHAGKRKNGAWIPIADPETGELFFPELVALINHCPKGEPDDLVFRRQHIDTVTLERTKGLYPINNQAVQARAVREAAELPGYVTFAAFRHGGLTALRKYGFQDRELQLISRHKDSKSLDHYLHDEDELILEMARRKYRARRTSG